MVVVSPNHFALIDEWVTKLMFYFQKIDRNKRYCTCIKQSERLIDNREAEKNETKARVGVWLSNKITYKRRYNLEGIFLLHNCIAIIVSHFNEIFVT